MLFLKTILNYVPSLIVLIFSMVALYGVVGFIDAYQSYEAHIFVFGVGGAQTSDLNDLRDYLNSRQAFLYWSVIVLGFSGFILAVIHAQRLHEFKKMHVTKQRDLQDLKVRMTALEAARDGILILDVEKNIVYLNRSLCIILGVNHTDKNDLFGKSWSNLFSEGDLEVILEDILPDVSGTGFWVGEFPIYKDDGSVVYTELSFTDVVGVGFVATMMDVTYRQKAEEEKKILQDQFYQAQKMEAIGRLAGGIAHDFNNILASMNGYAEFLVEDLEESSDQRAFAQNILQAGMQARSLVDKMLAFSRKDDETFEEVDILFSIEETLSMLNATLSKKINLHHESSVFSAHVKGNPTQISQLLMNLCINAQDAMDDGHGRLSIILDAISAKDVRLENEFFVDTFPSVDETPFLKITEEGERSSRLVLGQLVTGQEYVKVRVEDTGSGIPKMILEHIFDPFFTTKSVDKGTGLGLAAVHGVIASHRGCMVLHSTLLEGTSFDLYFPLIKSEVVETPVIEVDHYTTIERDRSKKRILLVEDQEDVRVMMLKMLKRIGYQAISAVSGRDGLEVVREDDGKYDLIITDYNMPEMTGLEMVNSVFEEYPDLPFIVLSGHAEKQLDREIERYSSIKAFLKKPVSKDELSQHIDEILDLVA